MTNFELTYRRFSEDSILVEWPPEITKSIVYDVLSFKNMILNYNIKGIIQINNAYNSILVIYDFAIDKINDEISTLKSLYDTRVCINRPTFKLWRIPVCYDEEFGLDLDVVSKQNKLSKSEVVRLHYEPIYTIFFIGFLPGFLYLGGLDKRLHFPRRSKPRIRLKKGAVAIGGGQTGIYPNVSPGGWHIIGNSPIEFFKSANENPCFAQAGDQVQFVPIPNSEYKVLVEQIKNGTYQLESEVFDG
ncbi:5-oxoprolinase subunit PxpB [uncultured Psychroserpens sp.]|uniref:5-oxoprolinase subunit PxpB n=1 Tax=uncultured Psychroserpens sp. TaxID=255436 RepID=UPI00260D7A99|nr:5-oxoprolinase subunit PxpB [uncultured Psychroserpens sp.]